MHLRHGNKRIEKKNEVKHSFVYKIIFRLSFSIKNEKGIDVKIDTYCELHTYSETPVIYA